MAEQVAQASVGVSADYSQMVADLKAAQNAMMSQMQSARGSVMNVTSSFSAAGMMAGARSAFSGLMGMASSATSGMQGIFASMRSWAGQFGTLGAVFGGQLMANLTAQLASIPSALSSVFIGVNAQMEQTQISMEVMLGSASRASAMVSQLWQMSAATPFSMSSITHSAQQLLTYGFAADRVRDLLTDIGDAASASPQGMTLALERITRALGQMHSRTRVSASEMLQLSEAGIGGWQFLADHLGRTIPEIQDMVSRGQISSDVGIEAITAGMRARFGGMMERQSQSFEGLRSTLADVLSMTFAQVGLPIFTALRNAMSDTIAFLNSSEAGLFFARMQESMRQFVDFARSSFEQIRGVIAPWLPVIMEAVQRFWEMSAPVREALLWLAGISTALVLAGAAATPFLMVFGSLVGIIGTAGSAILGVLKFGVLGALGAIAAIVNPMFFAPLAISAALVLPPVLAIAGAAAAFFAILRDGEGLGRPVIATFRTISLMIQDAWANIMVFWGLISGPVTETWQALKETVSGFFSSLNSWLEENRTKFDEIMGNMASIAVVAFEVIKSAWETVWGWFQDSISGIGFLFTGEWRSATENVSALFTNLLTFVQDIFRSIEMAVNDPVLFMRTIWAEFAAWMVGMFASVYGEVSATFAGMAATINAHLTNIIADIISKMIRGMAFLQMATSPMTLLRTEEENTALVRRQGQAMERAAISAGVMPEREDVVIERNRAEQNARARAGNIAATFREEADTLRAELNRLQEAREAARNALRPQNATPDDWDPVAANQRGMERLRAEQERMMRGRQLQFNLPAAGSGQRGSAERRRGMDIESSAGLWASIQRNITDSGQRNMQRNVGQIAQDAAAMRAALQAIAAAQANPLQAAAAAGAIFR